MNVKAEISSDYFHVGNVWHFIGKHLSLLILFTLNRDCAIKSGNDCSRQKVSVTLRLRNKVGNALPLSDFFVV